MVLVNILVVVVDSQKYDFGCQSKIVQELMTMLMAMKMSPLGGWGVRVVGGDSSSLMAA